MRQFFSNLVNAQSAVAGFNSDKIDARQIYSASFVVVSSNVGNAGALKLQASNDPTAMGNVAMDFSPTNWVDIPSATVTVAAGGIMLIPATTMAYAWIRAVWTPTAGAGTLSVICNAQGF